MKNVFKGLLFVFALVLTAALVSAAGPDLSAISAQTVNEGSTLTILLTSSATDNPADSQVGFNVCQVSGPTGTCEGSGSLGFSGSTTMTIAASSLTTAILSWTPDFTQANTYYFNISASDTDSTSSKIVKVTVVNVAPQLAVTSPVLLGGDTQERSDPNHDTTERREINVSGSINVQNSGPEALTNLHVASITFASGFSSNDLTVNYTFPKDTLAVGETITVPISVRMPQRLDAVDNNLNRVSPLVATLNFVATPSASGGTVTGNAQVQEKAQNNLRLKTVKIIHGDKSETVKDGDKVEKLKAGEAVSFEIEVENRFKDKQDVKMEDVTVRVVSDSELDIDEDDTISSLSANDQDTVKMDSVIDDTANDGTFDVVITADGTDEFGARHGEKMTVRFEVKRASHEISIESMSFNPPTISCESSTRLTTSIKNTGRRDESETFVRASAPELNFGTVSDKLSLDKDDQTTVGFNIPIPANTKPGSYRVTVDTYYNTGTQSVEDAQLLTVKACSSTVTTPPPSPSPPPPPPPVVVVEQPPKVNNTTPPPAATATGKSFLETPQYVALLVLAYVVVLVGGAALLLRLTKK